jgi:hypothetical protein
VQDVTLTTPVAKEGTLAHQNDLFRQIIEQVNTLKVSSCIVEIRMIMRSADVYSFTLPQIVSTFLEKLSKVCWPFLHQIAQAVR